MIKRAWSKKKPLFIPFLMAGYPNFPDWIKAMNALVEAGADIIEVGVPFSDPMLDGPINKNAAEVALKNGATLPYILEQIEQLRCHVPIILFSYLNPIESYGYDKFITQAVKSGVSGILIADLPIEEGKNFYKAASDAGLEIILLAPYNINLSKIEKYIEINPSFIYYISRPGPTGIQQDLYDDLSSKVQELRDAAKNINISVGFGISTPEQAKKVAACADGVIIGSLFTLTLGLHGTEALQNLAEEIAGAIHSDHN